VRRRAFLGLGLALPFAARAQSTRYPEVRPGFRLDLPRDHGAHPEFRQEWWYVTGWLATPRGESLGFQVTFFRARPDVVTANPSAFVPRQVMLAHAAISDPGLGRLRHEERAARDALGLAGATEGNTQAWVDDWKIELKGELLRTRVRAREFAFELEFAPSRLPVANGDTGYSRKGPRPEDASYYYSWPQLQTRGFVERAGVREQVRGTSWMDHEWSSRYMPEGAQGWDWCGINLEGGASLMAFRMRDAKGGALWAGGTLLAQDDRARALTPDQVSFAPRRRWRSPRTGTEYPVEMRVSSLGREWALEPLMDDQELDARASTGTIYWEGAVRAKLEGVQVGLGYLELTGYWRPIRL